MGMGEGVKLFLFSIGFVVICCLAFLVSVVHVMKSDAEFQTYRRALDEIVNRAIQLDRAGKMQHNWENSSEERGYPKSYIEAPRYLNSLDFKSRSIDCNLNLNLDDVDPIMFGAAVGVLISVSPLHYVAFFRGPVPDITPFLDASDNISLIGPSLKYGEAKPKYNSKGRLINGLDVSREVGIVLEDNRAGFLIESTVCQNYNYLEIKGVR